MTSEASGSNGFTVIELLIVLAVVAVVFSIGTPLYLDWRADSLNREATSAIEQAIAASRLEAKRTGNPVTLELRNGQTTVARGVQQISIPNGGVIQAAGAGVDIRFVPPVGSQVPYSVVGFEVRTGNGLLARTATVTVIPPLAKTVVIR